MYIKIVAILKYPYIHWMVTHWYFYIFSREVTSVSVYLYVHMFILQVTVLNNVGQSYLICANYNLDFLRIQTKFELNLISGHGEKDF